MRSRAAVVYEYGSPWTVDEIHKAYAAKAAGELIRGVIDFGVTRVQDGPPGASVPATGY